MDEIIESDFWKTIREANKWNMIDPNLNDIKYKVNTFDDGNEKYENYENIWKIYGNWKGKYALINNSDSDIRIPSISMWKTVKIS